MIESEQQTHHGGDYAPPRVTFQRLRKNRHWGLVRSGKAGYWALRYRRDGVVTQNSTGTTDVEEAAAVRDSFVKAVKADPTITRLAVRPRGRPKTPAPDGAELPRGVSWRKPWVVNDRNTIVKYFSTREEAEAFARLYFDRLDSLHGRKSTRVAETPLTSTD